MIKKIIIIVILIIIFYIINSSFQEDFRSLSTYSKQFIEADTKNNFGGDGYLTEKKHLDKKELDKLTSESSFVANHSYTDYLCDDGDMQMISSNMPNNINGYPVNNIDKSRFVGCSKNSNNFLGINWKIPDFVKNMANNEIKSKVKIEVDVGAGTRSNSNTLNAIYLLGSGKNISSFTKFNPQPTKLNKKYTYIFDIKSKPNQIIDTVKVNVGNDWLNAKIIIFIQNLNGDYDMIANMDVSQINNTKTYNTINSYYLNNKISITNINPTLLEKSLKMGTFQYNLGEINPDGSNFNSLKRGNEVGTWSSIGMKSGLNFSISFWVYQKANYSQWRNIIHVTNSNRNCCAMGDRIPAIWVWPNSGMMHIRRSANGNGNWGTDASGMSGNCIYHQLITFTKEGMKIYRNGVLTGTYNNSPNFATSPDARVYISDPWHPSKDLYVKNIIFWDSTLNEMEAKLLYEKYVPIIKTHNSIKVKGNNDPKLSDQQKFNSQFTLRRGLFLGYYGSFGFNAVQDITISFKIKLLNTYIGWRNIFMISNNNLYAGGVKGFYYGTKNNSWSGPGSNQGSRLPSMWSVPNSPNLLLCVSSRTTWNQCVNIPLELNQWATITITRNSSNNTITANYQYIKIAPVNKTVKIKANSELIPILDDASVWLSNANSVQNDGILISNFEIRKN